jgi:UDP-2,4-diacetamido-2,4,6-trideoxy-beta-L-altropyranose hydrolase
MRVVFRADASLDIGYGHVKRCLTLAHALRERGDTVSFICASRPGDLRQLIRGEGVEVQTIDDSPVWSDDAKQTRAALSGGGKPDWLVVDHYGFDAGWEKLLRGSARRLMVIDDLADRPHDCDLLLDQNLVGGMKSRYDGKVPAGCRTLLGPRYAMVQAEYARRHGQARIRSGKIERILISFGGADTSGLAARSLSAFLQLGREDVGVDIVVRAEQRDIGKIESIAGGKKNIRVHRDVPTLAPLMAEADLAIGAGGSTSWERLCLGLPSIVITIAENQRPIAEALQEAMLVKWLGGGSEASEADIAASLEDLLVSGLDGEWSARCLAVVDGLGVTRVVAALDEVDGEVLRARRAALADEAMLLEWANDPETRRNSFSRGPISAATHHTWFERRLRDEGGCRIYIVETDGGVPVGQVRFERGEAGWEIDYALSREFRGRGLGRMLMRTGLESLAREYPAAPVVATAKKTNVASRRVFESLGFESQTAGDTIEFRSIAG